MLHNWICALTAASAVSALAKQLTADANVKKVTQLLCGVVLSVTLAAPLLEADIPTLSLSLSEYRRTAAELTGDGESAEEYLLRQYIEQQCAAYILREAHTLGVEDIHAVVRTKWRGENWVPYEAEISGTLSNEARNRLRAYMESELGIPPARQVWDG